MLATTITLSVPGFLMSVEFWQGFAGGVVTTLALVLFLVRNSTVF